MKTDRERREYLRADINIFVNESFQTESCLARTVDICECGICYQKPTGSFRRFGHDVFLEFSLPDDKQSVKATARVIYDHLDDSVHTTAVEFSRLDASVAERVRNYVISRKRTELFESLLKEHLAEPPL